jgi:type VI secretion system VasD/TssJ family lipoprotein
MCIARDDNRSSLYFGAGGSFNFLKSGSLSKTGGLGISANIGYDFNEYIAVEFRKGTSLTSEASVRLDDSMVLYAKGRYPISDTLGVYALTGFSSTEVSSGISDVVSDSSIAYGLGIDYKMSTSITFYTDYSILASSVSQINFGVAYYYNNKGQKNLPPNSSKIQSFKERKADEKLVEALRIKEKLEAKKKKEAEEAKKKAAEEKLTLPTIVKIHLLHKEDSKKPILVYFFELKSNDQFKRMDYEELISNEKEMLDGEIITRSKEILTPGKMSTFEFNVKFDSKYYAVVAALNDVRGDDSWRHIVKVNGHEVNSINLMLNHKKIMEFRK